MKIKIPVYHYIEVTSDMTLGDLDELFTRGNRYYVVNRGGKKYVVEVWNE